MPVTSLNAFRRKNVFILYLFLIFPGSFFPAAAEIRLPAILGSHMVLQQKTMEKIWGWSEPGERITISTNWDTTTYHATGSANAKWLTQINTPAAGGPYTITIKGNNSIVLEDVLI